MRLLRATVAEVLGIYLTLIEGGGRIQVDGKARRHEAFEDLFDAFARIRQRAVDPGFLRVLEEAHESAVDAFDLSEHEGDPDAVRTLLQKSRDAFWRIAEDGGSPPSGVR